VILSFEEEERGRVKQGQEENHEECFHTELRTVADRTEPKAVSTGNVPHPGKSIARQITNQSMVQCR